VGGGEKSEARQSSNAKHEKCSQGLKEVFQITLSMSS